MTGIPQKQIRELWDKLGSCILIKPRYLTKISPCEKRGISILQYKKKKKHFLKKKKKATSRPHLMDTVDLFSGCRVTTRKEFTFNHQVPRSCRYPQRDDRYFFHLNLYFQYTLNLTMKLNIFSFKHRELKSILTSNFVKL